MKNLNPCFPYTLVHLGANVLLKSVYKSVIGQYTEEQDLSSEITSSHKFEPGKEFGNLTKLSRLNCHLK